MLTRQIMVCDSEPHIVRAISLKFMRAGFDVKGATDVDSCWRLLHRGEPPELLILDRSMPSGPDGTDLVRRIRADVHLAGLPIIILTANRNDSLDQIELLDQLKVSQIISKPFGTRELLVTVNRLLCETSEPHLVVRESGYRASDCKL